jgi:hypothetical protein
MNYNILLTSHLSLSLIHVVGIFLCNTGMTQEEIQCCFQKGDNFFTFKTSCNKCTSVFLSLWTLRRETYNPWHPSDLIILCSAHTCYNPSQSLQTTGLFAQVCLSVCLSVTSIILLAQNDEKQWGWHWVVEIFQQGLMMNSLMGVHAGYICVRAFNQRTREPQPLATRLHQSGKHLRGGSKPTH